MRVDTLDLVSTLQLGSQCKKNLGISDLQGNNVANMHWFHLQEEVCLMMRIGGEEVLNQIFLQFCIVMCYAAIKVFNVYAWLVETLASTYSHALVGIYIRYWDGATMAFLNKKNLSSCTAYGMQLSKGLQHHYWNRIYITS